MLVKSTSGLEQCVYGSVFDCIWRNRELDFRVTQLLFSLANFTGIDITPKSSKVICMVVKLYRPCSENIHV